MVALVLLVASLASLTRAAFATEYKRSVSYGQTVSAGGTKVVTQQYRSGSAYLYRIKAKVDGKSKVVASNVKRGFVTNGRYLYYSQYATPTYEFKRKTTLYRMDLKKGTKKKLATGTELLAMGSSGRYVYYGTDNYDGGVNLFAMNVSSLSKVRMVGSVGSVQYSNGCVVTTSITGSAGNFPVYTFKENGTGRVKIANAFWAIIRGNYLYFTKFRYKDANGSYVSQYRVYRSDYTGKSPKAVTGWVSYNEIPQKYRR